MSTRGPSFPLLPSSTSPTSRIRVIRYSKEWREIIERMGRWIDFDNDYKTMEPWYMESVWWVFKQVFDKGLVYQSYKVMPYSTACCTPLSNFEAQQNYKEGVIDPAVVITFPCLDGAHAGAEFLAWTTTPWTLPSNLALCVHPEIVYVKFKDLTGRYAKEGQDGRAFIMGKARLCQLYPKYGGKKYKGGEVEILEEFTGATLKGLTYEPLFPYFGERAGNGSFKVCVDEYGKFHVTKKQNPNQTTNKTRENGRQRPPVAAPALSFAAR
mgnify:CR=1 FL=1|jgi:isoleucyl-tRNA synthetase